MLSHVRVCLLVACLLLRSEAHAADAATALLTLPSAVSNWDAATGGLAGAAWQPGTRPCGDGGTQAPWRGVTCSTASQVTTLTLTGLGLEGTLPGGLAGLASLQTLDLSLNAFKGGPPLLWTADGSFPALQSANLGGNLLAGTLPADLPSLASQSISLKGNRFEGTLPGNWSSPTLAALDLSSNLLSGPLPPGWGDRALPALALLGLEGNNLEGLIPMPQWTDDAFAVGIVLDPRPGNRDLCGPVMPLDPELFPAGNPEQNQPLIPACNQLRTGSNMTHVVLTQRDLFTPGTEVTITNWLGSCASPCSEVPAGLSTPPAAVTRAGLPWPPAIQTNIYDISWQYNMSITDLVELNPSASKLAPGSNLNVPCYPDDTLSRFMYYGGSLSFGQFSGGNQKLGSVGLPGAMAAARINGGYPNQFHVPSVYTGNLLADSNGSAAGTLEPVYWFVDLLTPFHVTNVLVTAGGDMRNATVYVGSNSTSVTANTRVSDGFNLAAGQQVAVPGKATLGRYVIIYTGTQAEGTLSLDDVQVYSYETNAAAFKPAAAAALTGNMSQGGASSALGALVDNNPDTCVQLAPDANNIAWAHVDLGYLATLGSVVVRAGPNFTAGTEARAYVTRTADEELSTTVACNTEGRALQPDTWNSATCNKLGRYVTIQFPSVDPSVDVVEICEFQASVTAPPTAVTSTVPPASTSGGGGLSGGAIAGIVIGSLAGLALLLLAVVYLRWRHRWVGHQRRQMEAVEEAAENKDKEPGVAPLPYSVQHYGDGDEETGGGAAQNGGAAMAVLPDGVLVTGSGKAVAPAAEGGWDKPVPHRFNEFQLIGRFLTSLRHGRHMGSLSHRSSQDSGSRRRSGFTVVKGGAASDHANATTDLTKLPPGFLEVSPADIKLVECVGEGSFGEVWLAEYCGALVAVKILAKVKSDFMTHSMQQQLALRNLQKEALLMSKLRHPNVCLYLGAVTNPPCLVMEYCAKCSLDHLLRAGLSSSQMAKRLTWVRLLSMALDAAKGMLYLHTRVPPIAHRDLKSANLLVDSQWRVKVADFSLSRALEIGSTAYTVVSTNPRWLAPEVLSGNPGQLPADVWAFGTVLWEMCTWRLPFEDLNTFQIIAKVQSQGGAGLKVPSVDQLAAGPLGCYPQYVELMQACWITDTERRPTFHVIKERLADMLTAELLPLQQAAAAAAAERSALAAAMGAQQGSSRESQQQHAAKRNSGSSSGRGAGSAGNSLGAGSSLFTRSVRSGSQSQ